MDITEQIAIRRATLEWRDKWIAKILEELERGLALLFIGLYFKLDKACSLTEKC